MGTRAGVDGRSGGKGKGIGRGCFVEEVRRVPSSSREAGGINGCYGMWTQLLCSSFCSRTGVDGRSGGKSQGIGRGFYVEEVCRVPSSSGEACCINGCYGKWTKLLCSSFCSRTGVDGRSGGKSQGIGRGFYVEEVC